MRRSPWKLSMALLVFSTSAWSYVAQPAAPPEFRPMGPVLAGTVRGEARRKALLGAIEDWKTFLPESQLDPTTAKFSPDLHQIKDDAAALKTGDDLAPVEKRFEDWKQKLLSDLYREHELRFFSDPSRFRVFMQERLDILSAIRVQKLRAPGKMKELEGIAAEVNGLPDRSTLDQIYDKLMMGKKPAAPVAIRAVSFTAPTPTMQSSAPPTLSPDNLPQPPAVIEPPPPASSSMLSRFISSVSKTARRYANDVADAIVNFSRKLGLDEKLQAAIIWAESAFNPHAKSSAGAMGLGQLMPGTARGLSVKNAYDIHQNVKGSTRFLKDRLDHFSEEDEMKYMQGLYAWGKDRVHSGHPVDEVWKEVFAKTPMGIKNALASYNAGQGAIDKYGDYSRLPVKHTAYAESHNKGYWETIHYVPAVLRRYFEIQLRMPTSA